MDAVTYPDNNVINFMQGRVIPVRVPYDHKPLSEKFNVKWTPTLITLDSEGKESHRTVGFLGPDELIPSLLLGIGKAYFESGRFQEAISAFNEILTGYPKSHSAPEAIYLRGVSLYKSTKDPKPLRGAYDKLSAEYSDSEWAKRAYPYRLIE
ncbi:MAG TPA: tetratricopeptide repeat protein [Desulfomonilaceae bacterium]|nr:tetratricopeptide repeat protein [Desulfomonilaceae bacterium]